MITKYIIATLTLFTSTALAQTSSSTPSPAPSATTFESSGRVETKMFIPEDLMRGSLHTIGEQAENDGLLNTYFLYSGDDAFAVTTGIALRTRIREIYAIDKLRAMSQRSDPIQNNFDDTKGPHLFLYRDLAWKERGLGERLVTRKPVPGAI